MFDSKSKKNFVSFSFLLGPFISLWVLFWMVPTGLGLDLSLRSPDLEQSQKSSSLFDYSGKGESFNQLQDFSDKVHEAYLIGETAINIKKALSKHCKIHMCENLEDAVLKSYKKSFLSKKKYPILLSPASASFDKYKNFESRGKHFKNIFLKISKGNLL